MQHNKPTAVERSLALYRRLLRAYPPAFREEYGDEMARAFRDAARAAWRGAGHVGMTTLWARTFTDTLVNATRERVYGSDQGVKLSPWQVLTRKVLVPLVTPVAILAAMWGIWALNARWLPAVPAPNRGWVVIIEAILLGLPFGLWRSNTAPGWNSGTQGIGKACLFLWLAASESLALDATLPISAPLLWFVAEVCTSEDDRLHEVQAGIKGWKHHTATAGPALIVLLTASDRCLATNAFLGFVAVVNGIAAIQAEIGLRARKGEVGPK